MTLDSEGFQVWEFEDWVRAWFDHPDDWHHWGRGSDKHLPQNLRVEQYTEHLTRLFETSGETLAPYSDEQIARPFRRNLAGSLDPDRSEKAVSLAKRRRRTISTYNFYEQVFAPRCAELLGSLSEKASELNGVCYMWWDINDSPGYGLNKTQLKVTLEVLERILYLPNAACQESALHALNHCQIYHPVPAQKLIDAFLASGAARRPELVRYALICREGGAN